MVRKYGKFEKAPGHNFFKLSLAESWFIGVHEIYQEMSELSDKQSWGNLVTVT